MSAAMLVELRSNLARRGIEFCIAREIGQFRDAVEQAGDAAALRIEDTSTTR